MKKIILAFALMVLSATSFSKDEPYFVQSITINIDDVADVNAIPDLLAAIGYPGGGNAAAKAAFIKAYIVSGLQQTISTYRANVAASNVRASSTTIPIN